MKKKKICEIFAPGFKLKGMMNFGMSPHHRWTVESFFIGAKIFAKEYSIIRSRKPDEIQRESTTLQCCQRPRIHLAFEVFKNAFDISTAEIQTYKNEDQMTKKKTTKNELQFHIAFCVYSTFTTQTERERNDEIPFA